MGILQEEKRKINSELKFEKKNLEVEKLIDKINAMSPEERQKFMKKLAIRMRLDYARMRDLEIKQDKLEKIPDERRMSMTQFVAYILSHSMLGGWGAYAALMATNSSTSDTILGTAGGVALGAMLAFVNELCYEGKPISGCVNELKKVINEKNMAKLSLKMELDKKLEDGIVQMEAQGDYMDLDM